MAVPLNQVIYFGEGSSNMPVCSLMYDRGGIGVVDADSIEKWGGYEDMFKGREVQNLAPADYRDDSELMQSILLSVESVCKLIAVRRLSRGE